MQLWLCLVTHPPDSGDGGADTRRWGFGIELEKWPGGSKDDMEFVTEDDNPVVVAPKPLVFCVV